MGLFSKKKKKKKSDFIDLKVIKVSKQTEDAVAITLEIPSEEKENFKFSPGQYLTIEGPKGERRSYSICSSNLEDTITIAAKKIPNGIVSSYLNDTLKQGDVIPSMLPAGNFIFDSDQANKSIVAIAAGSGITPIMSMIKSGLSTDSQFNFTLFYINKNENSIIFKDELTELSKDSRFNTAHYLTQTSADGFESGRLKADNLDAAMSAANVSKPDSIFLCGPEQMINELAKSLEDNGVQKDQIKFELFTTPTESGKSEKESKSKGNKVESKLKIILDDETSEVTLSPKRTILEGAEKAKLDAPFSCRGAVCCTCKAKVLEGSAEMDLNYSLTDQEVADGYILTCQAYATTPEITVSFDE